MERSDHGVGSTEPLNGVGSTEPPNGVGAGFAGAEAQPSPLELAARALRHRDRSRHELEERLARAGVDEDARADALETLERVGYVDDARFAEARARALADRGYGDKWIRHELRRHGVAGETAEAAIAALTPEGERAAAVVARFGPGAKTAARLARKGFGEDAVEAAVGAAGG
ncbi:MAG: regulatory protein RecX [Gaiellaceae bacterium]